MDVVERTSRVRVRGPARLVWALLADSDRIHRTIGAPPSQYLLRDQPGDLGPQQIGTAPSALGPLAWTETGTSCEGEHFHGLRTYADGPLASIRYRIDVEPDGDAVAVLQTFAVAVRSPDATPLAVAVAEGALKRSLRLVDAADRVLAGAVDDERRASFRVLESLLLRSPPSVLFRRPQPTDEAALAAGSARLATADVAPAVRDVIIGLLRDGPDEVLAELRPRLLARAMGLVARDVLHGCVEGARAGLLTLEWRPICAACRGPTATRPRLVGLGHQSSCLVCAVTTPIDAARSLEAVFAVAPAVRRVERIVHCASGLGSRPWVVAAAAVGPRGVVDLALPPVAGDLEVGVRGIAAPLAISGGDRPQRIVVSFDAGGLATVACEPGAERSVRVINASDGQAGVEVRRPDDDPERTYAVDLFALPAYLDVFAGDRPDPRTSLAVGRLAVLFADVVGSTATYATLGDGPAYALVEQYFVVMRGVVRDAGGSVVKTMGDAVMAVFPTIGAAIDASFALHAATANLAHAHGLRIGVHEGSCLAIDANGTLDYFGKTVNLAARLQGRAGPRETAMTTANAEANAARLAGVETIREDVVMKGIAASVGCVRIRHG